MLRDTTRGRTNGQAIEFQRFIGRSLRAVFDFRALGERVVYVDCDVLENDGGTCCAAITGSWVAVRLAAERLLREGRIPRLPLTASVAAVSCGIVAGAAMLDLDYAEEVHAEANANVVMTGKGELIAIQANAGQTPLSRSQLEELLALAATGIATLHSAQKAVLGTTV